MNNIEKLAINREAFESVIAPLLPNNNAMYDALAKYSTDEFNGQYMDGDVQKAWVKFQALQSSEPVAKYKASVGGFSPPKWVTHQEKHSGNLGEGYLPLFTHPPASVPLEKYNRAIKALKTLVELKHQKDTLGKVPTYMDAMPIAWNNARQAIAEAELSDTQPPCDNNHVAEGCEKFKDGVRYE